MGQDELAAWRPRSVRGAADHLVAAGLLPATDAATWAQAQFDSLLPRGVATPLHQLSTVRTSQARECVGHVWTWVRPRAGDLEALVVDVEILPEHRGRGLGRAAMVAAQHAVQALGASVVRLNVHVHNRAAVRLYEGLGYDVSGVTVTRRLDERGGSEDATPSVILYAPTEADRSALTGAGVRRDVVLPGPASSGQRLWVARDLASEPVAVVQLQVVDRSDGRHAVGHHVEVVEGRRRQGVGRSVVRAVEGLCVDAGIRSVTMTVDHPSSAARALVERCGYRVAARSMTKAVAGR